MCFGKVSMNSQIEEEDLKVSVIIPVYNAEKYLGRCLAAVLGQTYSDLEIILINDGSTDSSGDIIRSFDDERIVVIGKENEGVSAARNDGLKRITGSRVVFVDADDYPEPDAILTVASHHGIMAEYPVVMKERLTGISSIGPGEAVYYMTKVSLSILMHRLMRSGGR